MSALAILVLLGGGAFAIGPAAGPTDARASAPVVPDPDRPSSRASPPPASEPASPAPASSALGVDELVELAEELIASDQLEGALILLDRAIERLPDAAEPYLRRAQLRELAAGADPTSPTGLTLRPEIGISDAIALLEGALRDLERYESLADPDEDKRRTLASRRARLRGLVAIARREQRKQQLDLRRSARRLGARADPARFDELVHFRYRRRVAGGVIGGVGVGTAMVGAALAAASVRVRVVDESACIVACRVRADLEPSLLVPGAMMATIGAAAAGVGVGMIVRNPRPLEPGNPRLDLDYARAGARANALRTAGTGMLITAAVVGVSGLALTVVAGQQFAAASAELEPSSERAKAITRTANTGVSLLGTAPVLAATGGALRTALVPEIPGGIRFAPIPERARVGLSLSGRF